MYYVFNKIIFLNELVIAIFDTLKDSHNRGEKDQPLVENST